MNCKRNCDIMLDQIRAIDTKRLIKRIGKITKHTQNKLKENLAIILDF